MAGTSRLCLAPLMAVAGALQAGAPGGLPFDHVAPGTTHVVFYRIEGEHQFLFVYRMPERRLEALEVDRRAPDPEAEGGEEAGEIVHHLPLSRLGGRILFLAADHLPAPRRQLLELIRTRHPVFQGVALEAAGSTARHWLGLALR